MIDPNGIMMIEPSGDASAYPVVDALTRKMAAAYRRSTLPADDQRYRGWHTCRCGAKSDNADHFIDGVKTNSLCVHYLAFHRKDVPPGELAKVQRMSEEAEPSEKELQIPSSSRALPMGNTTQKNRAQDLINIPIRWGNRRGG